MTSNKTFDISMDSTDDNKDAPDVFAEADDPSIKGQELQKAVNEPQSGQKATDESNIVDNAGVAEDVNKTGDQNKPMPIRKKHRRGSRRNKRRKYKPYPQLTWEEKKEVEERDSRRAVSIREKYMHEKGRPLAPFNTSQFLMAEHDTHEPDLHVSHHHHESHVRPIRLSSSADDGGASSASELSSDEDRDIEDVRSFLQKDFTETYERLHSESLHRMNKDELVNEYMQLEDKVEDLEKELTNIKSNGKVLARNGLYQPDAAEAVASQVNKVNADDGNSDSRKLLEIEVEKLREENRQLHIENSLLRPKEESTNI